MSIHPLQNRECPKNVYLLIMLIYPKITLKINSRSQEINAQGRPLTNPYRIRAAIIFNDHYVIEL